MTDSHELSVLGHGTIYETAYVDLVCSCGWKANTMPGMFEENPDEHGTISLRDLNALAEKHLAGCP